MSAYSEASVNSLIAYRKLMTFGDAQRRRDTRIAVFDLAVWVSFSSARRVGEWVGRLQVGI